MRVTLFCLFLFNSLWNFACTCEVLDEITEDEILNVGEAFIGTIKEVVENETNYTLTATFEVTKYLKGKLQSSEIVVITNNSGASCGLNFKIGQKWYIFAHYYNNELHANLCGRSVQLSKVTAKAKRLFIGKKNYRKKKRRARKEKMVILRYNK